MDSCHLLNFLFGSRKTTSELSKHLRASFNEACQQSSQGQRSVDAQRAENKTFENLNRKTPRSPLKVIQAKLVSLTNSAVTKVNHQSHVSDRDNNDKICESDRNIYHARLVESIDECETSERNLFLDLNNNQTTVNYIASDQDRDKYQHDTALRNETQPLQDSGALEKIVLYDESVDLNNQNNHQENNVPDLAQAICNRRQSNSERVKDLVQSFELSSTIHQFASTTTSSQESPRTPFKFKWPPDQVQPEEQKKSNNYDKITQRQQDSSPKPIPPKTPPKSNRVKFLNMQMRLDKPTRIDLLFQDESFLVRFFDKLEPIERCNAAQVCRKWRNILYSKQDYWRDLISVIDCTQLRREYLLECIINTLQSARLKHHCQSTSQLQQLNALTQNGSQQNKQTSVESSHYKNFQQIAGSIDYTNELDQNEVWKIQEICQRFARGGNNHTSRSLINDQQMNSISNHHQQQQQHGECQQHQATTPKSSSIPSQISSTLSSASISSLLSPLSESSRVESIRERLYTTLDDRGFNAICLYGASDDDIQSFVCKTPPGTHRRILVARLDNCCITDTGLDLFISTFNQLEEFELSGCNEITNAIDFKSLSNLKSLKITDCINIADGLASRLVHVIDQLSSLTIQAYHLTDAFLEYICGSTQKFNLKQLLLPNCKEITNHSLLTITKSIPNIEQLSISGSTRINDEGIEILCESAFNLKSLDMSWCTKISDASLECISADLGGNLRELILDRNINISDTGLTYLTAMTKLTLVYIRWCPRVTDVGLESLLTIKSLEHLSLAGLHQITARSLLCLIECNSLKEVELTNCPAVNSDLLEFLSSKMPGCHLIF